MDLGDTPLKLGTWLKIEIGKVVPEKVPAEVVRAVSNVQVSYNQDGMMAFGLTFNVGRGLLEWMDYPLVANRLFSPLNRIKLTLVMKGKATPLMDGVITNHQLTPSNQVGASTFTVTGEGLTVLLDMKEEAREHPSLSDNGIVYKILSKYASHKIKPSVIPARASSVPSPSDRVPIQVGTDLAYVRYLAVKHGYVFHIRPPDPLTSINVAYWGPPRITGVPQKALSMNFGATTNVEQLDFEYDALAPAVVDGIVQDRNTGHDYPVRAVPTRIPDLASLSVRSIQGAPTRSVIYSGSNVSASDAHDEAQSLTDASARAAVSAKGELDGSRYGAVLQPYGVVGVRGVGRTFDGNYYVSEVTHLIRPGSYRQRFSLARGSVGALLPVVNP